MTDRLRIGITGAGWWAVENHLPILRDDPRVDLVAVCRLGAAELEKVRAAFEIPFATEDFDEMLAGAEMDALVVTSPHALHGAQALAALRRGLHVMVEKPMTLDPAEARAIEAEAAARQLTVLVPYGWNFKPFIAEAHRMLAAGRVGRIRHVAAQMASPIGDLMRGAPMAGTEAAMFRPDPAMWADAATGGYGWGQLVHLLGGLFHLAEGLEPARVGAVTARADAPAGLAAAATVIFGDGAIAAVSGAAGVPHGKPFQFDLRFYGDEGMLLIDAERERVELTRHDGTGEALEIAPGAGAYECVEPVRRFVSLCLGEGGTNPAGATVGRKAVEVVAAMHRAAAEERIVNTGRTA